MIRTFIQVLALSAVLLSSFFLIRGTITLSIQDLADLSRTKYGYNLGVVKNLARQRSDTIVGFTLLLLSFLLQLINMLWPMRIDDFAVNKTGVVIAIIVSILIFIAANGISNLLYTNSCKQVENTLTNK